MVFTTYLTFLEGLEALRCNGQIRLSLLLNVTLRGHECNMDSRKTGTILRIYDRDEGKYPLHYKRKYINLKVGWIYETTCLLLNLFRNVIL